MNRACPYLGIPGDQDACHGFPSALNVCYGDQSTWSEFKPVAFAFQRDVCLTPDYSSCPVYLRCLTAQREDEWHTPAQSYLDFFGLRKEPFSIVPLPSFMCESASQRQALTGLQWLLDHRQGLGLVLGPIGVGKTLLCRVLNEELQADPRYLATLLLTPAYRSEYALTGDLLERWNITPRRRRSLQNLETAAYQFLVEEVLQRQRTVVLIVDEAQTLSQRLLRHICKLLNWQEQGEQLLQIILVGQPVLERKLLRVPALRDRAVVEFTLTAMSLAEVQQMINQRLRQAGRRGDLFTAGATHLIAQHARGMPRRVIVLCLQSMWLAYRREQHKIRADLVQHAISHAQADVLSGMPEDAVALLAADQAAPARREPPSWMPRILQRLWVRVVS